MKRAFLLMMLLYSFAMLANAGGCDGPNVHAKDKTPAYVTYGRVDTFYYPLAAGDTLFMDALGDGGYNCPLYKWYKDSTDLNKQDYLDITEPGVYYVGIGALGDTGRYFNAKVVVYPADSALSKYNGIYPIPDDAFTWTITQNPLVNGVTIFSNEPYPVKVTYTVANIAGQQILFGSLILGVYYEDTFDVSNLGPGIYFITVDFNGHRSTQKVFKL